uniref:Reverse transcriptase/retrotransposon-derived protein RNase H-like domain-containing protein n=1 Tax=Sinocyclocheilus grahami TaxID=75366 RepID=A0A672LDB5_SINGR
KLQWVQRRDSDDIAWTAEIEHAFRHLKASLTRPPALGLPKYTTDFHLYVHEGGGTAAAILAQEHGGIYRPVAYLSKTLDSVARGLPACLRNPKENLEGLLLITDSNQCEKTV